MVALLDNEKIQVTFSYQHKEGKLTKIERKRRNMLVGIKIHKESILFIPLIISYFSLTTNLHFLKQGRPSHRNMNVFMNLPLFMFCRSHCANQSFKFILQVPFKSSVSKRINSRVKNQNWYFIPEIKTVMNKVKNFQKPTTQQRNIAHDKEARNNCHYYNCGLLVRFVRSTVVET